MKTPKRLETVLLALFSLVSTSAWTASVESRDLTVGKGKEAREGSLVAICYESQLGNGTRVSSNKGEAPFAFEVGSPEVIVGLSDGVAGMRVGGVREVSIPSSLAYGRAGRPGKVPPNSDLQYFVRLRFAGHPESESWKQQRLSQEDARKKISDLPLCVLDAGDLEGVTDVGD